MAIKKVSGLLRKLSRSFLDAAEDLLPTIFRDAAEGEGESSGGVKFHGKDPIGIPGAKFHAMTGQMEKSHDVRRARMEGKSFSGQVLDRPDYYGAFEKYNSLQM